MITPPDSDASPLFSEIPDPYAAHHVPLAPLRVPELGAAPTRARVRNRRLAALTGSSAWLSLHLAVYGIRDDFQRLPALYVASQVLLPFSIGVASLLTALASGKLSLGAKLGLVIALAILGPLTFCLMAAGAPGPYQALPGAQSLLGILVCFDITIAWAALPLLCAALALPRAFVSGVRWRSALTGAGIGLFASAAINLHCPNVSQAHILFGHGLPVFVATIFGALVLGARTRA